MYHSRAIGCMVLFAYGVIFLLLFYIPVYNSNGKSSEDLSASFQMVRLLPKPPDAGQGTKADASPSITAADVVPLPAMTTTFRVPEIPHVTSISPVVLPVNLPVKSPMLNLPEAGGNTGSGGGDGSRVGSLLSGKTVHLFGMDVQTQGPVIVYLDNSESIKKQHDIVENQIKTLLPAYTLFEINGCLFSTKISLERMRAQKNMDDVFLNYYFAIVEGSVIQNVIKKIEHDEIEDGASIYFFSDFEDYENPEDLNAFSRSLQDHHIHFYAHSVEKDPDENLKRLCLETGGEWVLKPVK